MKKTILGLAIWGILASSVFGADSYSEAYRKHITDGKPLIISIGATWCPPCRLIKTKVFPLFFRRFKREDQYHYCEIDIDDEAEQAKLVMVGDKLPQTTVYKKDKTGKVFRYNMSGSDKVTEFLEKILNDG